MINNYYIDVLCNLLQQLNALNKGEEEDETISVAEMRSLAGYDDSLKEVADYQFYVAYDFYAKNNSHFHRSPYYGYYQGEFHFIKTLCKIPSIRF